MLRRSVPVLATAVRCEPAPRARRGSVLLRLSWPASCASGLRVYCVHGRTHHPCVAEHAEGGRRGRTMRQAGADAGTSVRGQCRESFICAIRMWMGAAGRGHAPCALHLIPSDPDRRLCWLCACVVLRVYVCGRVRVRLGRVDMVQLGRREDCFQGRRPLRCPRLQHQ